MPNPYYAYYVKENNEADLLVKLQSTPKKISKKPASDGHFLRHKDRLAALGLIEAELHFRVDPSHNIKVGLQADGHLKGPIGNSSDHGAMGEANRGAVPHHLRARILGKSPSEERLRSNQKDCRRMHVKAKNEAACKKALDVSKHDIS